jgi:hypothetical protein
MTIVLMCCLCQERSFDRWKDDKDVTSQKIHTSLATIKAETSKNVRMCHLEEIA